MELEAALSMKEAKHLCNTILLPTTLTVPMVGEQLLQLLVLNVSLSFSLTHTLDGAMSPAMSRAGSEYRPNMGGNTRAPLNTSFLKKEQPGNSFH